MNDKFIFLKIHFIFTYVYLCASGGGEFKHMVPVETRRGLQNSRGWSYRQMCTTDVGAGNQTRVPWKSSSSDLKCQSISLVCKIYLYFLKLCVCVCLCECLQLMCGCMLRAAESMRFPRGSPSF